MKTTFSYFQECSKIQHVLNVVFYFTLLNKTGFLYFREIRLYCQFFGIRHMVAGRVDSFSLLFHTPCAYPINTGTL